MKAVPNVLSFLAVLTFAGCATQPRVALNQPVGPSQPHLNRRKGEGTLVVYSAPEVLDQAEAYFPTHSAYTLWTTDGKRVASVDNRTGSFDQEPMSIALPVGSYQVRARATNVGPVLVPVVIEEGRSTVVHLDGRMRPEQVLKSGSEWVRLPDGQVVGQGVDGSASRTP